MEIEEQKWGVFRTNNGEWISGIHIEVLDKFKLFELKARAAGMEKKLDIHYGYYEDGERLTWCYKNDIKELLNQQ
jgi:hypothetical protein